MITLDLTPTEKAHVLTAARQTGLAPGDYIRQMLLKQMLQQPLPPAQDTSPLSEEKVAAIALLRSMMADAPTDPEEVRQAEADLQEFMHNLNQNRLDSGERPLLP